MSKATSCATCPAQLIPGNRWKDIDATDRLILQAAGSAPHAGRGLCNRCYYRAREDGTLADYERTTTPADMVVAEWHRLSERDGSSRAEQVRRLAPRLGMSEDALERALDRAGVRGVPQQRSLEHVVSDGTTSGCQTCRVRRVEVGTDEADVRNLARKLARDPSDLRLRRMLDDARERLADRRATFDAHLDLDHQEVAA